MYRKYLEDEKTSILLFWFIFVLYALVYLTKNCFSAAMAAIVHEGVMTKTQTGLISSLFYLVYAPLQVVGGRIADRRNPYMVVIISLLGSAIANFAIFLNQNYIFMLVVWTLNAVAQFGVYPAVFKIVSSQLAKDHRAKSVYYLSFSNKVGLIFAYVVAMFMTKWQYNFLFSAITLFVLAAVTFFVYPHIDKHMVEAAPIVKAQKASSEKKSSAGLFLKSGLYVMIPVVILKTVIQNSQQIAPTLLMESYDSVSPVIGNFLSVFIIGASLLGTIFSKYVYYHYIRNEVKGYILVFAALIPFLLIICFVGKLPTVLIVICLALVAFLCAGTDLFNSFMSMHYTKFGKNAEAAGLINSAASIGFVVQTYGIALIADLFGWITVTWLWVIIAFVAILLLASIYKPWKKFIADE